MAATAPSSRKAEAASLRRSRAARLAVRVALVVLLAAVFVLVNFAVDLIYVFIDPRIRYS